jgi:3-methyladenine DNA glycosylase/8-oxoguanine DNA glycosylase
MPTRTIPTPEPLDLVGTVAPLRRGRGDPTMSIGGGEVWRATRTADGPATVRLRVLTGAIECEAWGAGASRALEDAPAFVGALDDPSAFQPDHAVLRRLHHDHTGLRLTQSRAIIPTLIAAICEQKVTGQEARRSYRLLTRATSGPAPGPADLMLPPDPELVAEAPSSLFVRAGLAGRRGETMRSVCRRADRLETLAANSPAELETALSRLPGVGPWTVAEVCRLALGDPDAVSVGDFHLPNLVAWMLAGEPRGTDERMLELLEPYTGQRGRVQLLLEASGVHAPRYGPRMEVRALP